MDMRRRLILTLVFLGLLLLAVAGWTVQGGVTSGLLNAVVAEDLPGPGSVFLHVDWSFKAPVKPGDEITAEVEVLEAREDKPISKLRTTITNQEGTIVLDGTALVWSEPL